jgi:hypothetical protein
MPQKWRRHGRRSPGIVSTLGFQFGLEEMTLASEDRFGGRGLDCRKRKTWKGQNRGSPQHTRTWDSLQSGGLNECIYRSKPVCFGRFHTVWLSPRSNSSGAWVPPAAYFFSVVSKNEPTYGVDPLLHHVRICWEKGSCFLQNLNGLWSDPQFGFLIVQCDCFTRSKHPNHLTSLHISFRFPGHRLQQLLSINQIRIILKPACWSLSWSSKILELIYL